MRRATLLGLVALGVADAAVRQILERPGEIWGPEPGADRLVVVRGA